MLSFQNHLAFYTLQTFGRGISLGIHKGKTLDKGIMLFLKLSVFLIAELVFNSSLLSLAVCLKQGICKGINLTVGVLHIFSYFIKSCYHFIKLLALVLILFKQEQGEPLYLLIIHTFKGNMLLFGSVHHLFKMLAPKCIFYEFFQFHVLYFYVKNSFSMRYTNTQRGFITDFQSFTIKLLYLLLPEFQVL